MNKRQVKKKNKNQFDAYCRNYKERRIMQKNIKRAEQKHKFEPQESKKNEEVFTFDDW